MITIFPKRKYARSNLQYRCQFLKRQKNGKADVDS